ncbi:MAG TPA: GH25 family lysozyme [Xanthobacteraceae bacterium]|nr:GH25 family lysozyme [Xanthobacteraceae bacterium]
MTYAIRCGLIAVACWLAVVGTARARDADANMDGPSRAELFELRWKSDLGPNAAALAPKLTQPFFIPKHILGDRVYGIALSYHNDEGCACKAGEHCSRCRIDWAKVADSKIAFVFLKATHGARYKDPAFEYHWRALAQHKMHRGARHFMSADEDPVEQADHFVERLEAAGKLTAWDLPPVLELERDLRRDAAKKWIVVAETGQRLDFWQGQDPDEIAGKILKWLNRVEQKTGRVPIIYTSRSWWMERIKDEKKFALLRRYPLWIADYPETGRHAHDSPKVPNNQAWTIWQFTENGRMEDTGIVPGNMEVSVFRGTLARFRQAMKVSAVEAEVARTEDKKTARGGQQVAAVNPQQVSDASGANAAAPATSATSSAATPPTAAANASQAAAAPQKPDQATQAPLQATNTASSQVAVVANPAPPAVASPPQQVRQTPQPQAPQQSEGAPPQARVSAPPNTGSPGKEAPDSSKSSQTAAPATQAPATAVVAQAPQPSGAVASEQPATANTAPQTSANQGQTAANASERVNAAPEASKGTAGEQKAPPAPQVAAVNLSPVKEPVKEAAGPNQGAAAPTAGSEKAKAESRTANTASVAPPSRTAQRNSGQRPATEKAAEENTPGERSPTDKSAERIMIEIELLNGRKLRVDANIDPALLERLINAIDK